MVLWMDILMTFNRRTRGFGALALFDCGYKMVKDKALYGWLKITLLAYYVNINKLNSYINNKICWIDRLMRGDII